VGVSPSLAAARLILNHLTVAHDAAQRAAFLRTVAAGLRALGHLLIVFHALAGLGAFLAASGAAFEHWASQRTLTRTKRRACLAALGAIRTKLCRLGMLFFPVAGQRQAMLET
jgi:hypothetical protein